MSGLVYRDLLTFYRKNTKVTYIMEAVYFLFFLLVLRNIYGAITFLVIASPISMSGLPATMKDLDTNYKGMMSARLMPYTQRDIVTARFQAAFSCHLLYLAEMLLFCILHHAITGSISWKTYALLFLGGWLSAVFITSVNLLSSFITGLNAASIIYLLTVILPVGLFLLIMLTDLYDIIIPFFTGQHPLIFWILAVLLDIIMVTVSYLVSVKRFTKQREKL
ncbi:ABC-2 transporter permease [Muricomes sp. OA1]|uniref:ABC-2 transporter permease n=1 Tax=Hungatella hathewayi TaxID=154046 RepID=A0A3E2WXB9_9FIRM|nr:MULTISPECIES: ABC-2 transporter permease [Clostridia]MEE0202058.1 ABC-2 transporter permease [Muricomes sp.]MCH1975125.1 ABC-2 transporter permease [Muricomes sp. OA1]MRM90751.1 ABC-2 transporter permease [Faecalicatena contorta]RGC32041.1 ABC-2 transporter permease [Hungatella hathewayi]GKH33956.1 hypothetical protein CE91St64_33630 [Faecalicatena contorta]